MHAFTLTRHLVTQAEAKNIQLATINEVLTSPTRITPVTRYPNQARYIGFGICVIVDKITRTAITTYLDGVFTPLRPDQIERGEVIRRTH